MNSTVLFLCCCSNRKVAGGDDRYQPERTMPRSIHEERGRALLEARQKIFQQIQAGARSMQGTSLRDLPYNNQLVCGPDLGGRAAGTYWPAMKRYRGRFYQELDPEELGALDESPHHWLIVSALYGLLTPKEPIQMYSCHTLDDERITGTWRQNALLTSLLLEYIRVSGVKLIVDLMADVSYHELFNWEKVSRRVRVLRAFGEQNAGPGLLPALEFLARTRLLTISAEELTGIQESETYVTDYEDVVLTPESSPPEPFLSPPEEAPLQSDEDSDPQEERPVLPKPLAIKGEGCVVLPQPREIPVTSDDHRTIIGRRINHIRDLPSEPRRLFDQVSRAAEVLSVRLGRFTSRGRTRNFNLITTCGRKGDGVIDGRLTGPDKTGQIGGIQRLRIRVTPGREQAAYLAISRLLTGEVK